MIIRNPLVENDLKLGNKLKLDFGSGPRPREGYYGIDLPSSGCQDILADLNRPLKEIPTNCADHIYTRHTLEHLDQIITVMEEIHRIADPCAQINIVVPHFSNVYGYSDVTHKRLFGLYSMFYFSPEALQPRRKVPCYYSSASFQVMSVSIRFYRKGFVDGILGPLFQFAVNRHFALQEAYERRFAHFYHAWELDFELKPLKCSKL